MSSSKPRIAILGAGPTGLEAALAAAESGHPFTVYEATPAVAGNCGSKRFRFVSRGSCMPIWRGSSSRACSTARRSFST